MAARALGWTRGGGLASLSSFSSPGLSRGWGQKEAAHGVGPGAAVWDGARLSGRLPTARGGGVLLGIGGSGLSGPSGLSGESGRSSGEWDGVHGLAGWGLRSKFGIPGGCGHLLRRGGSRDDSRLGLLHVAGLGYAVAGAAVLLGGSGDGGVEGIHAHRLAGETYLTVDHDEGTPARGIGESLAGVQDEGLGRLADTDVQRCLASRGCMDWLVLAQPVRQASRARIQIRARTRKGGGDLMGQGSFY